MKQIFAIDPGTTESGFCIVDYDTMKPLEFCKLKNEDLLNIIDQHCYDAACWQLRGNHDHDLDIDFCIEMVASYGMPVGAEVFETCVWIGRFLQAIKNREMVLPVKSFPVHFVYRKDEKLTLCGSMKANDAAIRRALIDKYAKQDFRSGKGTKNNPDWFYGFKKDVWAAYAVAVTWKEMEG